MRFPAEAASRLTILGLTIALGGCGLVGGGERPATPASERALPTGRIGPAADYPIVVGEPYTVEGELFTPADTLNYDEVGFASIEPQAGAGVTIAHKTLPLPSYVEVTALDSGKTILARVERRGPMSRSRLVSLSAGAQAQLGIGEGAPVRVRRVNPPEIERAELRAGRPAPERMDTPKSLAEVLRRKLPASGAAGALTEQQRAEARPVPAAAEASAPAPVPVAIAVRGSAPVQAAPRPARENGAAPYPLPPLPAARAPVVPVPPQQPPAVTQGFVIQAAAFASKANAERAAAQLEGFISPAGKYFRVRTGPYSTRGQAEAALAKVRAAGYSDAKVFRAS